MIKIQTRNKEILTPNIIWFVDGEPVKASVRPSGEKKEIIFLKNDFKIFYENTN